MFYGVELEIDKGGDYAEEILNTANAHNLHLYAKHDGSIDDGFELVAHPMTLEYHTNTMNWSGVMDMALSLDYRSHQTQTCGLHIHVNRKAFGNDYDTQEDSISRIVHFVEMHWNELLKFSRRTEANMNRWASRYGISTTAKDTYKNAKAKHCGRYVAINLENYSTIEFRIFRGTLRYKTFLATLQLVDEICNLAIKLSDRELEGMSWSDFVIKPFHKYSFGMLKCKTVLFTVFCLHSFLYCFKRPYRLSYIMVFIYKLYTFFKESICELCVRFPHIRNKIFDLMALLSVPL